MTRGPRQHVPFRRRRRGQTNYRRRLGLLKAEKARAVVRKTLSETIVQFVRFRAQGDEVLASATSRDLRRLGWKGNTGNVPAAYLTGFLAGRRARAAGVEDAVLDIGLHPPTRGGRLFAALRGLQEAGVGVPSDETILPDDARTQGEHLSVGPAPVAAIKEKLEES